MKKRILHSLLCALILVTQSYTPCRADDTSSGADQLAASDDNTQEKSYVGRLYNKFRGTENTTQTVSDQNNGDADQNQKIDLDADDEEEENEEDGVVDKFIDGVENHPGVALGVGVAALAGLGLYTQSGKNKKSEDQKPEPNRKTRKIDLSKTDIQLSPNNKRVCLNVQFTGDSLQYIWSFEDGRWYAFSDQDTTTPCSLTLSTEEQKQIANKVIGNTHTSLPIALVPTIWRDKKTNHITHCEFKHADGKSFVHKLGTTLCFPLTAQREITPTPVPVNTLSQWFIEQALQKDQNSVATTPKPLSTNPGSGHSHSSASSSSTSSSGSSNSSPQGSGNKQTQAAPSSSSSDKDKQKLKQPDTIKSNTSSDNGNGDSREEDNEDITTLEEFFAACGQLVRGNDDQERIRSLLPPIAPNVQCIIENPGMDSNDTSDLTFNLNKNPCSLKVSNNSGRIEITVYVLNDQKKWIELSEAPQAHPLYALLNPTAKPEVTKSSVDEGKSDKSDNSSGSVPKSVPVQPELGDGNPTKPEVKAGSSDGSAVPAAGGGAPVEPITTASESAAKSEAKAESKTDEAGYDSESDSSKRIADHVLVYYYTEPVAKDDSSIASLSGSDEKKATHQPVVHAIDFEHNGMPHRVQYQKGILYKLVKDASDDSGDAHHTPIDIATAEKNLIRAAHLAMSSCFSDMKLASLIRLNTSALSKLNSEQQYKVMCATCNLMNTLQENSNISPLLVKHMWFSQKHETAGYITVQDEKKKILGRIQFGQDGNYAIMNGKTALTSSEDAGVKALVTALIKSE